MASDMRKRALPLDDMSPDSLSATKKQKAPDGSPVPAPPSSDSAAASVSPVNKASDILAKARAIARAKAAAAKQQIQQKSASPAPPPPPPSSEQPTPPPSSTSNGSSKENGSGSHLDMKALLAEIAAKKSRVSAAVTAKTNLAASRDDVSARGGLNVGVHPALLGTSAKSSQANKKGSKLMAPKYSSTMANSRKKELEIFTGPPPEEVDPRRNPYFDPTLEIKPKIRGRRVLEFSEKGKYIEQARELRSQAQMEELKQRIEAESKKARAHQEIESADLALKVS